MSRAGAALSPFSEFWYGTFCVGISLGGRSTARSRGKRPFGSPLLPTLPFKAAQTTTDAGGREGSHARAGDPVRVRSAAARPPLAPTSGGDFELYVFIGAAAVAVSLNFRARSGGRTETDRALSTVHLHILELRSESVSA